MIVYRFEQKIKCWNGNKHEYEERWEGVFGGGHMTYPEDANYQTHGCTLWQYKYSDYRFACRTLDKLVEYFGSDFSLLIGKEDVRLMEYEVKKGDCFFSSKHIELVFKASEVISKRRIA